MFQGLSNKLSKRILIASSIFFTHVPLLAKSSNTNISEMYELNMNIDSQINSHLPALKHIAQDCSHITEIGASSLTATWGLLEGLRNNLNPAKKYIAIDFQAPYELKIDLVKEASKKDNIDFKYWAVNDLYIMIEPTDLLYIDSVHTYKHLQTELNTFCDNVNKYIVLHHTAFPWGYRDDPRFGDDYAESAINLSKRGSIQAILDFIATHPEWSIMDHKDNNFGLTILKRLGPSKKKNLDFHPNTDNAINKKMILCTGPSFDRYDMLKKITESDLRIVPFKKIFFATNDPRLETINFLGKNPTVINIPKLDHQLDCLNCIIANLKAVANDPEALDDDIVLFKHESVFINDLYLFKKSVSKVLEGYDMVARIMSHLNFCEATDAFFIKVSAIRNIIKNHDYITSFPANAPYCEQYFSKYIVNKLSKIYKIPSYHLCCGWVELGFYHYHANDWKGMKAWDRVNYADLFKN